MKKLLVFTILLLVGCSPSQLRREDRHFVAKDELNKMMKTFYINPQPDLVLAYFDEINKQVKDPNSRFLMVPFAGEVFKKYPTEAIMWSHRMLQWKWQAVPETVFWSALKYSELKVFNEVKEKALVDASNQTKNAIVMAEKLDRKEYYITTTPKEVQEVDSLWGRFFATGNKVALQKIISGLEIKNKSSFAETNVVTVITWSITANAKEDPNLLKMLKTELKGSYPKQVKDSLKKIIASVESGSL
jgi:hypothetical protein